MFVDENGEISNSLVVSAQGQTISLRGCLFDPSQATAEQLENYEQNVFTATFGDILNPSDIADLAPFVITVTYDDKSVLYSDSLFIPAIAYSEYDGLDVKFVGNGLDQSLNRLGEVVQCCFFINFTVEIPMPTQDGIITIRTPVWASIYDENLLQVTDMYPMTAETSCTSPDLLSLETSINQDMITLTYASFTGSSNFEQTAQISLACSNWRNPIAKEIVTGYKIKTFDKDLNLFVQ